MSLMVYQKNSEYVTDQGFPNSVKGLGERIPTSGGGMVNFARSAFDHSNLFQIKKYYSVNLEHQLKLFQVCTIYIYKYIYIYTYI